MTEFIAGIVVGVFIHMIVSDSEIREKVIEKLKAFCNGCVALTKKIFQKNKVKPTENPPAKVDNTVR